MTEEILRLAAEHPPGAPLELADRFITTSEEVVIKEVTCACGNIKALAVPPVDLTNLRCWLCPKDDTRPVLRLVKL